jgi:VWFA-related protein
VVFPSQFRLQTALRCLGLSGILVLAGITSVIAQKSNQTVNPPAAVSPSAPPASPSDRNNQPSVTFKAVTRQVVLDVVAKDKQGHPVLNLTANDFQVFERVGWAAKTPETITAFRLVDKTKPREKPPSIQNLVNVPNGAYSNLAAVREPDDPLTVLLLDNLNADLFARDTRRDVLKMVDSTDLNVPVSVFYLSNNLRMLQDFDSNAKQLRSTVHQLLSAGPFRDLQFTAVQGPSLAMQQQLGVASGPSALPYAVDEARVTEDRVRMTMDALRTLARYLAGYPGRKKLIWVSEAFPFSIMPDPSDQSDSAQSYRDQIAEMANALSSAQVAVYPVRPGGVWLPDVFTAARKDRPTSKLGSAYGVGEELQRQSKDYYAASATMEEISQETGGESCLSSNDLGWCLRQALSDGYTYYELAYYPPSSGWKEGFHHITVKTTRPGVRLSYRQGYDVAPDQSGSLPQQRIGTTDAELKQAACEDQLPATGLPLTVIPLPPLGQNEARYLLKVEGLAAENVLSPDQHSSRLQLSFAACTFDASGKPLQYGQFPVEQDLSESGQGPAKQDGVQQVFGFTPDTRAARIRWLVQDAQTGALGSVNLPYPAPIAAMADNTPANGVPSTNPQSAMLLAASAETSNAPAESATQPPPNSVASSATTPKLQSEAEIASYCEALGQPETHAEALAKVCEFALSLQSKLPDLLCERVTTRHWRAGGNYPAVDKVTTQVAYRDGIEYDSDANGAAKPNSYSIWRVNRSSSSGEFAALLQAIFNPASSADFEFKGEQTLNSVPALVFEFSVEQNNNHLFALHASYLDGRQAVFYPAYRGRLWIDKSAFRLLRAERETTDVPPSFPISYSSTTVDYSNVALGDGTSFVLPVNAEDVTCSPSEGKECAHNIIRYVNYHKFRAKTRILFNQESP